MAISLYKVKKKVVGKYWEVGDVIKLQTKRYNQYSHAIEPFDPEQVELTESEEVAEKPKRKRKKAVSESKSTDKE